MDFTPEQISATGAAIKMVVAAIGGILATVVSTVVGYFTWKTRFELDQLYAAKYRPNPDGTPGKMRRHPEALVRLFKRNKRIGK